MTKQKKMHVEGRALIWISMQYNLRIVLPDKKKEVSNSCSVSSHWIHILVPYFTGQSGH